TKKEEAASISSVESEVSSKQRTKKRRGEICEKGVSSSNEIKGKEGRNPGEGNATKDGKTTKKFETQIRESRDQRNRPSSTCMHLSIRRCPLTPKTNFRREAPKQ
ncbi:hypothetical protein K0M31_009441, partial [Melipona bicolor]